MKKSFSTVRFGTVFYCICNPAATKLVTRHRMSGGSTFPKDHTEFKETAAAAALLFFPDLRWRNL
jgi:hypothetical protein